MRFITILAKSALSDDMEKSRGYDTRVTHGVNIKPACFFFPFLHSLPPSLQLHSAVIYVSFVMHIQNNVVH